MSYLSYLLSRLCVRFPDGIWFIHPWVSPKDASVLCIEIQHFLTQEKHRYWKHIPPCPSEPLVPLILFHSSFTDQKLLSDFFSSKKSRTRLFIFQAFSRQTLPLTIHHAQLLALPSIILLYPPKLVIRLTMQLAEESAFLPNQLSIMMQRHPLLFQNHQDLAQIYTPQAVLTPLSSFLDNLPLSAPLHMFLFLPKKRCNPKRDNNKLLRHLHALLRKQSCSPSQTFSLSAYLPFLQSVVSQCQLCNKYIIKQ